ncbi:sugar transferase [Winogradskyella arenosi]|uniref:Lipopolysaccharide/colanic/teichoic acid biosynthesis glycosyltransferase n=1 Tax=Winogradskyella arenosi TaxID=533325 RepID=A0A368ZEA5_9FLAO|nr:sugar transferase [Winogradskyella arenosi]RCW91518.1 lipopolysaccharide/colanic/teichoic acid biosynthesis glycosyltransferase [Winogradskyella arenosi]
MTTKQLYRKRIFDVLLVMLGLPILALPLVMLIILATLDTQQWGIFTQLRIGQKGKSFKIYKLRTVREKQNKSGATVETISRIGHVLRRSKLNEIPQLYNVLKGDMSLVGPRPDLPGFADLLKGEDRIILRVKPGLTGLASLKYRHEENILARQPNPEEYNRTIIWVDKVKINRKYVQNYTFYLDLSILLKSILNQPYTDDKRRG